MQTVWILGDQLSPEHAALRLTNPREARVLMVESKARGSALRYHKLKLVLAYSAMRHFAQDLRKAGWEVDYQLLEGTGNFEDGLRRHLAKYKPEKLVLAEPNSFPETDAVLKLGRKLRVPIDFVPTAQFLLPRDGFREWASDQRRLVMENHYRRMRKLHGWLMDKDGTPVGSAWNFDRDNRATYNMWKRDKVAQASSLQAQKNESWKLALPSSEPDEITRDVMLMVEREFQENPGDVKQFWLPVDRAAALRWLRYFIDERLPNFGIYEDMMAEGEPHLFHSVLSSSLNLGLLTPRECVEAVIGAYERGAAPINSVEGYVRQVIGWREFINGVYWFRGPEYRTLNSLGAKRPLPTWFYTAETPMNCLHHVVKQNLELGWNHHIQRLMVLGNFFLISGINPQEALRWYNEMYVDAYDWVMAPNVLGMALYADGGYMATKPYAATSTYIRKMSNYCSGCRFDPDQKTGPDACPFNYLYWRFIDEHAERFAPNPRMRNVVNAWLARSESSKEEVRQSARAFLDAAVPA